MAKFAGTWKFVSRNNIERVLELMGTAAETQKKMVTGLERVNTVLKWDEDNKTLMWSNKEADIETKVNMKMGEPFPLGPYAPGYHGVVYEMGDNTWKSKVTNPNGEEVGSLEHKIEGNKLYATTKVKGETSKLELKKVE